MTESYRTLQTAGEDIYEIKRSRFLALAAPAASESIAREIVKGQEKKYFDARHTCYAWVLGERGDRQKSSDGGEPGGTAGSPILEAIKAKGRRLRGLPRRWRDEKVINCFPSLPIKSTEKRNAS